MGRSRPGLVRKVLGELMRDPGEQTGWLWSFAVNSVAGSHLLPGRARTLAYKFFGLDIAPSVLTRPEVIFRSKNLHIGDGTTINFRCVFDNRAGVYIGRNCGIGIGVVFLNTDHKTSDPNRRAGTGSWGKVLVGDGVFIGTNAVIMPGVIIERGAVIAAGAVVTGPCAADGLYAGVPARRIRELPR